jgi:hypothetical protein
MGIHIPGEPLAVEEGTAPGPPHVWLSLQRLSEEPRHGCCGVGRIRKQEVRWIEEAGRD